MIDHETTLTTPTFLALALGGALVLASGCSSERYDRHTEAPNREAQQAEQPAEIEGDEPNERVVAVVIEPDILSLCSLDTAETYFEYDSSKLGGAAEFVLAEVADCFAFGPLHATNLVIVGHADPRGSDAYNQELGRERAQSVADYLDQEGVDPSQLGVESRGESMASDDPDHWRFDRKVVLKLED